MVFSVTAVLGLRLRKVPTWAAFIRAGSGWLASRGAPCWSFLENSTAC